VIRSLYKKPKAQSDKAVAFRALHQRDGARHDDSYTFEERNPT